MAAINGIEELYAFLRKAPWKTLEKRSWLDTEVREILIGEDTVLDKKQLIRDLFSRLVKEKPEPHPHAKSMMEYALTALESKTPYAQCMMVYAGWRHLTQS